jgi:hypothetical protein
MKFIIVFLDNDLKIYDLLVVISGFGMVVFSVAAGGFVLVEYNNQYQIVQSQQQSGSNSTSLSSSSSSNTKSPTTFAFIDLFKVKY